MVLGSGLGGARLGGAGLEGEAGTGEGGEGEEARLKSGERGGEAGVVERARFQLSVCLLLGGLNRLELVLEPVGVGVAEGKACVRVCVHVQARVRACVCVCVCSKRVCETREAHSESHVRYASVILASLRSNSLCSLPT